MSEAWSERIERHYAMRLPADVRAWFDQEVWKQGGGAEFNQPLTPDELIDPPDGTIWAGFMLPDTLPIIGNRYGDWLCLRAAADGTVAEIVWWSHNGGDWLPFGRTLAEALLYDAACYAACSRNHEHGSPLPPAIEVLPTARWAAGWYPARSRPVTLPWFLCKSPVGDAREELLELQIAEVPVRRDRTLACLNSGLRSLASPKLATELNCGWEQDLVRWMFDGALLEPKVAEHLSETVGTTLDRLTTQDWVGAEREAGRVCQIRTDLGWAFDIAGWAAERRGDSELAVSRYLDGVKTSVFTDDSVAFRTHWFEEGYGKFAAYRLAELRQILPPDVRDDPYLQIFWEKDAVSLRHRLSDHWMRSAQVAEREQRHPDAYRCFYRAGWDFGVIDISRFAEIFEGLVRAAAAMGGDSLQRISELHQRSLVSL